MSVQISRDGPLPLWEQVLESIRDRLEAGEFTAEFPGELSIAAEYQVSRHTVREALRRLRDDGVVTAGRGRKPRVTGREIVQQMGALHSLFDRLEAAGYDNHSRVRQLRVVEDASVAARLGLAESAPLVHLVRLRMANEDPLAIDRVWMPHALGKPLLDIDHTRGSLFDRVTKNCKLRIDGAHEEIRAAVPRRAERDALEMGTDVALLVIERMLYVRRVPVMWRVTSVRGDRVAVSAEFSATDGQSNSTLNGFLRP